MFPELSKPLRRGDWPGGQVLEMLIGDLVLLLYYDRDWVAIPGMLDMLGKGNGMRSLGVVQQCTTER